MLSEISANDSVLDDAWLSNTHKNSLLASGLSFDRLIKDSLNVIESGKKMKTYYYWPWQSPSLSATKMNGEVISVERKLAENWLKIRLCLFFSRNVFGVTLNLSLKLWIQQFPKKSLLKEVSKLKGRVTRFQTSPFPPRFRINTTPSHTHSRTHTRTHALTHTHAHVHTRTLTH